MMTHFETHPCHELFIIILYKDHLRVVKNQLVNPINDAIKTTIIRNMQLIMITVIRRAR